MRPGPMPGPTGRLARATLRCALDCPPIPPLPKPKEPHRGARRRCPAALLRPPDQALEAGARAGEGLAILYVDLDGFKQVNHSLGYLIGDELLVLAGQRIRVCLRPGDFVARLGGDEFVVVCRNISDSTGALAVAARIGSQLSAPFPIGEHHAVVSARIGLATTTDSRATAQELLRHADMRRY